MVTRWSAGFPEGKRVPRQQPVCSRGAECSGAAVGTLLLGCFPPTRTHWAVASCQTSPVSLSQALVVRVEFSSLGSPPWSRGRWTQLESDSHGAQNSKE